MDQSPRNVAILGATGSIGRSTVDVVLASRGRMKVTGLTAHRRLDVLSDLANRCKPDWVVATDAEAAAAFDWDRIGTDIDRHCGREAIANLVAAPEVDVVVSAIVGSAGLVGTWAAVEAGKRVALANKESLVVAGPLMMELTRKSGATIVPVDSEHSAVFQCLQSGRREELERVILTASGGPFRTFSTEQMRQVTVEQALAHPTWDMGPKITVDSATMMNKAFEIVEARWLFDLRPDQINVVIHPQSIVHSIVEFCDGSSIAQLSPPDMKLPIQYALTWPDRWASPAQNLNWNEPVGLDFLPADPDQFPALALGLEVARQGGTTGAVLNGANEEAVSRFLNGRLRFTEIVPACGSVLAHHCFDASPTFDELLAQDRWAREEVSRWKCS